MHVFQVILIASVALAQHCCAYPSYGAPQEAVFHNFAPFDPQSFSAVIASIAQGTGFGGARGLFQALANGFNNIGAFGGGGGSGKNNLLSCHRIIS